MSNIFRKIIIVATIGAIVHNSLFPPVGAVSEFGSYAAMLARAGVINTEVFEAGYRLGDLIARAEVAKIAVGLTGTGAVQCTGAIYSDVTSELGDLCGYIETAAGIGIISRGHSLFRFSDLVTRAELVKMLLVANGIPPSSVPAGFSDLSAALGDLSGYVNAGVAGGCIRPGTTFRPDASATRGEAFKMAACAMKHKKTSIATSYDGRLVWSDEFSGSSLDTGKWTPETGADGWGNNELQNYTETGNVSVSDGKLTIEARKENSSWAPYSSARINTHTKASWTHGKIEARIRLPYGQGIWPAFWMLGENIDTAGYPDSGEMDIVEMVGGKSPDDGTDNEATIWGTIHRPNYDPNPPEAVKSIGSSYLHPQGVNWSDDFHVYGLEWDAKTVKHTVDGHAYQITNIESQTDGFEVFHRPFYIILNVAVGGNWPGSPDQTTIWPQKMLVDWVRVYQK